MGSKQGNNSKNNGGQSTSGHNKPKGAECAALGASGRESKSRLAKAVSARRDELRQDGTLYEVKNAGRMSDIVSLELGQVGSYAFPGGNMPSAHFCVSNNGTPEEPFMVARFEGSHRGHPLPGNLNKEVFLPIFMLGKDNFRPKHTGDWGNTQLAMFQYLTGVIDAAKAAERVPAPVTKKVEPRKEVVDIEKLVNSGNTKIAEILSAKDGDLFTVLLQKGEHEGKILIAIESVNNRTVAKVKASLFPLITSKLAFYVPLHCLDYEHLTQVTSNEIYAQQCELHAALRWALGNAGVEIAFAPPKHLAPAFSTSVKHMTKQVVSPVATPAVKQEEVTTAPAEMPKVVNLGAMKKSESVIDYNKSSRLTAPKLIAKIKEGQPSILVHTGEEGQRAYFWRERVAGVQKLRLVKADDHPTLTAILEAHPQGVDVEVTNIVKWKGYQEELGGLGDIKNARKHLTALLHSMLPQMGFVLRTPQNTQTQPPVAGDKVEAESKGEQVA